MKAESQPAKTENRRLLSLRDLVEIPKLAFLLCCAWVLPERYWARLCRACAALRTWMRPGRTRVIERNMASILGPASYRDAALEYLGGFYYERMCLLRAYRPGGWRPAIVLEGRERIEAGAAHGQGVVLLASFFTFNSLVTKMALAQAGIAADQLSRPEHGFSTTRFGRRWLNPVMTTIENRYVASRVTMPAGGTAGAIRKLRKLLGANHVVIVTAGVEARRVLLTPLLHGRMRLAPGSFELSLSSGATLLPVFTTREPSGTFRCLIGAPLSHDRPDAKAEAILDMAARYAEMLAVPVQRYPGQWRNWYHVLPAESAAGLDSTNGQAA